ncbi:hypothetical protein V8G54_014797 [Vigna mungo]|uniref:Uncharacterized protein n=1 Tax=Vigna mungo TaxID=3915 RepID=A0AAQ3NKR5_VIGMU
MHIKDWNCCRPNESPTKARVLFCILKAQKLSSIDHLFIDFFSVEPKNKPVKKLNVDEKVQGYLFSKSEEIYKGEKKGIEKNISLAIMSKHNAQKYKIIHALNQS